MSVYRDQIAAALGAVTISSPTRYTWLGRRSRPLPSALAADLGETGCRAYLVRCLREELYCSFYCYGHPVAARWGDPEPSFADGRLVAAMSRANSGRGSWEPGWTVHRRDGDTVVVTSTRLRMRVPLVDCRVSNGAIRPGVAVSVRMPNELAERSPGFYTVVSETAETAPAPDRVRVYWHVTRSGAPELVGALASRLNAETRPFRLKVANHPYRLHRCDAAVLYLRGDAFRAAQVTLQEVAATLARELHPEIPALTLRLAPGVGLAEDDGESFGLSRCDVLADAIVRAHERGLTDLGARVDVVTERFAEEGISIDAPYLQPAFTGRHVL